MSGPACNDVVVSMSTINANHIVQSMRSRIWFEQHSTMLSAIERENQLKNMSRREKLKLVESLNPNWLDIAGQF